MYYVGKGCGKCCAQCCDGCCSCLSECFNCFGKLCQCCECKELCQRPFGGCTVFNFFVMALPFVACIVVTGVTWGDCMMTNVHLLIQGLLMLTNFLVCVYVMIKLGRNSDQGKKTDEPTDTWSKTKHLICYDFVICSYIFVLIFEFIWNILGHVWLADPGCSSSLEAMDYAALIIMWVWLGLSALLFCCSVTVAACDDGSCGVDTCLKDCFYCLCCCCCCSTPSQNKQERRSKNLEHYQSQPESKPKFIESAYSMLGTFGIFGSKKKQNQQEAKRGDVQLSVNSHQESGPPPDPQRLNDARHPPPDPVRSEGLSSTYQQPQPFQQVTYQQPQPYQPANYEQPQPYLPSVHQQPYQPSAYPQPHQASAYPQTYQVSANEQFATSSAHADGHQVEPQEKKSFFTKAKEKVNKFING